MALDQFTEFHLDRLTEYQKVIDRCQAQAIKSPVTERLAAQERQHIREHLEIKFAYLSERKREEYIDTLLQRNLRRVVA